MLFSGVLWFVVARKGFAGGLLDYGALARVLSPALAYVPALALTFLMPDRIVARLIAYVCALGLNGWLGWTLRPQTPRSEPCAS